MALDSITLYHLIKELQPQLIGTRIDKIQQPEKEEIHLIIRGSGKNMRLLLNAGSTAVRLHLSSESKKNPLTPPMFCMILRKHIENGKIIAIRQVGLERVVTLTIQNYNERGDLQNYDLHLEIMAKHSNLILVDSETNIILDGIRRYSHLLSRHREVLPGRRYVAPPSQNKIEPMGNEEKWMQKILETPLDRRISDILVMFFDGISPELAREIVLRAELDPNSVLDNCGEIDLSRLYQAYAYFLIDKAVLPLAPCVYYASDKDKQTPTAFSIVPYRQYADLYRKDLSSLNDTVDLYYTQKNTSNKNDAKKGSLRKVVQDHLSHVIKKDGIYTETTAKAQKGLAYQKLGELLTANLYKLTPGMKEVTVEDYTDPEYQPLTITLDPNLSGIDNAQRYYKIYSKAKSTIKNTLPLQEDVRQEMAYLQSLLLSIDQTANDTELGEVYQELIDQGYVAWKHGKGDDARHSGGKGLAAGKGNRSGTGGKKAKEAPVYSIPHHYSSQTGKTIIVGRNNKQNDCMTWREAKPGDLWLHVKNIPGSHVIVPLTEGEEFPDDPTLLDAAALAIYYSQARGSSHVPVDYTHVREIKKPRGAKPGMVVYEQNWSLLLTPDQDTINRLLSTET
ncbi:NFACT family protein [Dehalobacter sp. DCM]|uniref:Rqc2 family fibronectin-binding protein n=1 Tax=Dehalobacter sp. DCM TaxID=2907827 RepID=UPI0030816A6E|nr:NFACT family protein [Dehalobacter sp. DCM]